MGQTELPTLKAEPVPSTFATPSPTPCIQVQNRYIVSTLPSGILIIDQQAAHERVIFDRLIKCKEDNVAQQLLFPVNCQFSPADADMFNELIPDLKEQGFEIGCIGQCTFVVSATPNEIKDSELQQVFDQMLTEYKGSMIQKFCDRKQTLCRSLARQMSVKAGVTLQQEEMQQLIADLFCCQMPSVSPSGKKTMTIVQPENLLK